MKNKKRKKNFIIALLISSITTCIIALFIFVDVPWNIYSSVDSEVTLLYNEKYASSWGTNISLILSAFIVLTIASYFIVGYIAKEMEKFNSEIIKK